MRNVLLAVLVTLLVTPAFAQNDAAVRLVIQPVLESGESAGAVRVSVLGSDGRYVAPDEAIVIPSWAMSYAYWNEESTLRAEQQYNRDPADPYSVADEQFAYVEGAFAVSVPPGETIVRVYKGTEYVPTVAAVSAEGGTTVRQTVTLTRWTDPRERGWYSGDMHLHIARTPERDPLIFQMMRAEGVDVLYPQLLMTGGFEDDFHQPALGPPGAAEADGRHLYSGEEYRNGRLGHYSMVGIVRVVEPIGSGIHHGGPGSPNFPGATTVCLEAIDQRDRVLCQPDHGGGAEAFVALVCGGVNAWETMQASGLMTEKWLVALRAGYRLPPTAGSDYPYLTSRAARERNYVRLDGEPSAEAFLGGVLAGRTYVSRGPVLEQFTVNDVELGEDLLLDEPGPVRVRGRVRWLAPMGSLAVIANGRVVARQESSDATVLEIDEQVDMQRSGFILLRAGQVLLTGPIYVTVGDTPAGEPGAIREMIEQIRQGIDDIESRSIFSAEQQQADEGAYYFESRDQQQQVLANFRRAIEILQARLAETQGP